MALYLPGVVAWWVCCDGPVPTWCGGCAVMALLLLLWGYCDGPVPGILGVLRWHVT
jgi:hypothetical protein